MTTTHPNASVHSNATRHLPFTPAHYALIVLLYVASIGILWTLVGPWEALRKGLAPGAILMVWLWITARMLGDMPEADLPVKKPALELGIGALSIALGIPMLIVDVDWLRWLGLAFFVLPIGVLLALRYDRRAAGLQNAPRRAWLALLAVILANILIGAAAGMILPSGEATGPAGMDLSQSMQTLGGALLTILHLVVVAALPEEFALRVYLQPRLAAYLSPGWAIVIQALIFSALHLPQQLLHLGNPLPLALAYTVLVPMNGLIGGLLWRKTRSLPLLVILHLFAYPRYGL